MTLLNMGIGKLEFRDITNFAIPSHSPNSHNEI